MLILSWNVHRKSPDKLIEKIQSENPHIVTLQEITLNQTPEWARQLKKIGLDSHYASGYEGQDKDYQCLIASCWPLTPVDTRWRDCAPYPELLARATVSVAKNQNIDVFTAHMSNGSNHGWKKIDSFHVLSAQLRQADDSPRILTGDFNEPKRFLQSGQLVTWAGEPQQHCGRSKETWPDGRDERRLSEWTDGVLSVLAGPSHHGLRNAYTHLHGIQIPNLVSLYTGNNPRCYDHTFVSRHFTVDECYYHDEWLKQNLSDHAPICTKLSLHTSPSNSTDVRCHRPCQLLRRLRSWLGCATRALANLSRSSGPILALMSVNGRPRR